MITQEQFEDLKKHEVNSWALWDEKGLGDVEFFKYNIDKLHFNVIFTGLNPSVSRHNPDDKRIPEFTNFHTLSNAGDKKLHSYIQKNELTYLIGAFMTDLSVKRESNSNQVTINETSLEEFLMKIKSLSSSSEEGHIICFGNDSYNALLKYFISHNEKTLTHNIKYFRIELDERPFNIYRVWHYSPRGYNNKYVEELENQLKFLNNKFITSI